MVAALWRSRLRLYRKHYSQPKQWAIRQVARLGTSRKLRRGAGTDGALSGGEQQASEQALREVLAMLRDEADLGKRP